jgi:hypothetical protein
MSTTTARLGLVKETTSENYSVGTVNNNSDKIDGAVGFEECTSSTRPSAPFNGKAAWESDTGSAIFSNGSSPASGSWKYLWTPHGPVIVGAVGTAAPLRGQTTSTLAGNRFLDARKQGETQPGFTLDFDGKHQWGPGGSTAPDTNLYRSAADTLKTDDNLIVAGNLSVTGTATITGSLSSASALKYLEARSSGDETVTTSVADVNGATLTFTTAVAGTVVKVTSYWDISSTGSTDVFIGTLYVDGSVYAFGEAHLEGGDTSARTTLAQGWTVTLASAGSHTLKLRRTKTSNSDTVTLYGIHTKIQVEGLGIV